MTHLGGHALGKSVTFGGAAEKVPKRGSMSMVREELSSFKILAGNRSHSLPRGMPANMVGGARGKRQGGVIHGTVQDDIPDPVMMSDEDDLDHEVRTRLPRVPDALPAADPAVAVRFNVQ